MFFLFTGTRDTITHITNLHVYMYYYQTKSVPTFLVLHYVSQKHSKKKNLKEKRWPHHDLYLLFHL